MLKRFKHADTASEQKRQKKGERKKIEGERELKKPGE